MDCLVGAGKAAFSYSSCSSAGKSASCLTSSFPSLITHSVMSLCIMGGDRSGQHNIRINEQYRICFVWTDQGPRDVEITDYH
jgi:hypothetical protein